METNEEAILAAWWAARREIIDPAIGENRGRMVKRTGSGFPTEFTTTLDAVHFAKTTQVALTVRNADLPTDRRFDFRGGVDLGDIVDADKSIYGDGVDIATHIEAPVEPADGRRQNSWGAAPLALIR
jgi:adenylate cyclase